MELTHETHHLILVVGILMALSLWVKAVFKPIRLAPLTAFIFVGIALRGIFDHTNLFPESFQDTLYLLGKVGIVIILFNAGLECNVNRLISQFSKASYLAISNVVFCAVLTFLVTYYLLSLPLVACLFVSVAMTATSIGVTVAIWSDLGRERSEEGNLLMSLVAIDDIIGVLLMALLFEVAPLLHQENTGVIWNSLGETLILFSFKVAIFVLMCSIFSIYIEPRLMNWISSYEVKPDRIITILSNGFIIASIAGFFGFSLALGAFFAGIAMSHDKKAVRMETSFKTFEGFFGPFFFINIGFLISISIFSSEFVVISAVLVAVAFTGKYLGTFIPAMTSKMNIFTASLLGFSMIPRADVALVIMERGNRLGDWAVSEEVYSSMVVVSLVSCIVPPLIIYPLLERSDIKKVK